MERRQRRDLYAAVGRALSPVTVALQPGATASDPETLVVSSRADFPSMVLRGYTLRIVPANGSAPESVNLPDLAPGEKWEKG